MKKSVFTIALAIMMLAWIPLAICAEDNALVLSVDAAGDDGANIVACNCTTTDEVTTCDELSVEDWKEKSYYTGSSLSDVDTLIHPKITITNEGDDTGDLTVKFDVINESSYTMTITTYYCKFNTDTGISYMTLAASSEDNVLTQIGKDQEITLIDFFIDSSGTPITINGPVLITAILESDAGDLLGVDTQMVFFNTDFIEFIKNHAGEAS